MVPFKVKAMHLTENYCNLDLETCATMPPEHNSKTHFSNVNSRMVLRANKGDDTSFAVLSRGRGEFHIIEQREAEDSVTGPERIETGIPGI